MSNQKSILIITTVYPPSIGGVETHIQDLTEFLSEQGYYVYVLTYQPIAGKVKAKPLEKKKNLEIRRFSWFGDNLFHKFESYPPVFNFLYLAPYLLLRSFLFMLVNYKKINIIHAFGLIPAFAARVLKPIFRKKITMSTETLYEYKEGTLFSKVAYHVLDKFDKILAHSEDSKDETIRIGVDKNKIITFTHCINQSRFKPSNKRELKSKLGWEDKFTVLYVGRLIPIKGVSLFLQIAKHIKRDINFKIIGDDGPEYSKIKDIESKLNNLEYIGPIAYEDLPPYYAAADVFVYPALYNEDVSRALLESLSCGTPVINTNKGSGIYALNPNISFVTKPEYQEIQSKIEYLYDNPKNLAQMTSNCSSFAKAFGPAKCGKVIIDSYQQLMK